MWKSRHELRINRVKGTVVGITRTSIGHEQHTEMEYAEDDTKGKQKGKGEESESKQHRGH